MRSLKLLPLLLIVALSVSLSACKSDCEKFYDLMVECGGDDNAPDKEAFLEECAKSKDSDEGAASVACGVSSSDCAAFDKCLEQVREERNEIDEEEWAINKIETAIAEKAWTELPLACNALDKPDAPEAIVSACRDFQTKGLAGLRTEITALRDKLGVDDDLHMKCIYLEDYAEAVSPEEVGAIELLCEEANAVSHISTALAEAQANIDANTAHVPIGCSIAMNNLEKLGTDWAKASRRSVAERCYRDLGVIVLAAKVPQLKFQCEHNVQQVYDTVKEFAFEGAELQGWMEKAGAFCEPK